MADHSLLLDALSVAVPLRMAELARMGSWRRAETAMVWAREAVDRIACNGDMLLYWSTAGKRHTAECQQGRRPDCDCLVGTAQVFNHAARALAALALKRGGVTFASLHWCVEHPGGLRVDQYARYGNGNIVDSYPTDCRAGGYESDHDPELPTVPTFRGRPVATVELPEAVG